MPTPTVTRLPSPSSVSPGWVSFTQCIELPAAPERVFDFVTNTAQWHRWHPATRSVRDVPDRPLMLGEQVTEQIRAGGRRFEAVWTVTVCERASHWRIDTQTERGSACVIYRLSPLGTGGGHCRFERRCDFHSVGPLRFLDASLGRWMLARQAQQALLNLHQALQK